jgi:hypothetical protein
MYQQLPDQFVFLSTAAADTQELRREQDQPIKSAPVPG